jgi:hypothetical protein
MTQSEKDALATAFGDDGEFKFGADDEDLFGGSAAASVS